MPGLSLTRLTPRRLLHLPAAGNAALAERLVRNLVDNAVRYNVPGGRVRVRSGAGAGGAFLSVANDGAVIPASEVERLFEPFQGLGADRTAPSDGHHGLGLSIVRAIAAAHHATLLTEARPEGGLAVEVKFPESLGGRRPWPPGRPIAPQATPAAWPPPTRRS